MRRIGSALAIFLAVAALAGLTGTAASAMPSISAMPSAGPVGGTWSRPLPVPGQSALSPAEDEVVTSISCTGPGDCTAGGAYESSGNGNWDTDSAYVVSEVNGTWGVEETVPGTAALNTALGAATTAVSCSSPGNCAAVGYYSYQYGKSAVGVAGFVVNQVSGRWGTARPVPALTRAARFAQVTAVSCAPARTAAARKAGLSCVAVGVSHLAAATSAGFVLADVRGTWGTARPVPGLAVTPPGSAVTSVSCPVPGTCGIGGYYAGPSRRRQAFVANEVNGTWRKAQPVPGSATLNAGGDASVTSVSCPAAGACAAAGAYQPKKGPGQLFAVRESGGQWKQAIQLPGSGKLVAADGSAIGQVSCASAAACEVGGTLQTGASSTRGFLAGEANGRWSALYVVPGGSASTITALSCPAPGYCAAGGQRLNLPTPTNFPASVIVLDEAAGRWGKTLALFSGYNVISDTDSVYALSCAAPRSCGAGGDLNGGDEGLPVAFVVNERPA